MTADLRHYVLQAARSRMIGSSEESVGIASLTELHTPEDRNGVWRCRIEDRAGTHLSVIAKRIGGANRARQSVLRFQSEVRALRLLEGVPRTAIVPVLLGRFPKERLVVLEDLGDETQSRHWDYPSLIVMARVLGAVAQVASPEISEEGACRRIGDRGRLVSHLRTMGCRGASGFVDQLCSYEHAVSEFRRLSHGDPVRANLYFGNEGVRLLDFEFSELTNPLRDLATFYMGMPTALDPKRVRRRVLEEMLRTFQSQIESDEVAAKLPSALLASCAFWLLLTLTSFLSSVAIADRVWGTYSVRGRILTSLSLFLCLQRELNLTPCGEEIVDVLKRAWGSTPRMGIVPSAA